MTLGTLREPGPRMAKLCWNSTAVGQSYLWQGLFLGLLSLLKGAGLEECSKGGNVALVSLAPVSPTWAHHEQPLRVQCSLSALPAMAELVNW